MKKRAFLRVMVIVHGKSELSLCKSIQSNLRLKQEIIAEKKGSNSIQVTSLMKKLNESHFRTLRSFIRNFDDVEHQKNKLSDFKLFIIMDVDDCTSKQKEDFISKQMFKNHWLYDHIVPIFNDPNLEATMLQAGIAITKKKDYMTIFPTNQGDLNIDMAKDLAEKLKSSTCSNLSSYISYCIDIAESNLQE